MTSEELVAADARDRILQVAFTMLATTSATSRSSKTEVIGVVSSRDVFAMLAEHALAMSDSILSHLEGRRPPGFALDHP